MKEIFKDSILKNVLPDYEFRQEQLDMAEFVEECLEDGENALVEAGTGTGKTMAYLIPAVLHALKNGLKITISTETKALQKQLMDKDLPAAEKVLSGLGFDFSYALCLGSSNYMCRMRLETALRRGTMDKTSLSMLSVPMSLLENGESFTAFDVSVPYDVWNQVSRDSEICSGRKCIFFSRCPFQAARKSWQAADVLVMNHYLFFSNAASDMAYLPHTDTAVFDEAHDLEDIASAQLGFEADFSLLRDILELLHKPRSRNTLLLQLSGDSEKKRAVELWNDILKNGQIFFEQLKVKTEGEGRWQKLASPVTEEAEPLLEPVSGLLKIMNRERENIQDEYLSLEFDIALSRLNAFYENMKSFAEADKKDYIFWTEISGTDLIKQVKCKGQPVRISGIMQKDVLPKFRSVIFVSATLSVNRDFSYTKAQLGLTDPRTLCLASPFDYRKQALMFIDENMPEPSQDSYTTAAADAAAELIRTVNGSCLILFTSYRMLAEVHSLLSEKISNPIFSQGEMPAKDAVALYRSTPGAVLMGTSSFWQGIDLPGDLLRCVIMMRLPFSTPDSPVMQARTDELKAMGKNPFMVYQVPEAVIKFRQGFGRLIRSRKDRGIIAVLDGRITSKYYGKNFLSSVPVCTVVKKLADVPSAYRKLISEENTDL